MSIASLIRNNRATIVCGVVIAAVLAALLLLTRGGAAGDSAQLVALVHDGDGATHELPLNEDAQVTVTTSLGSNTIEVREGSVRVVAADCPNGNCLHEQPLSAPGGQIICLPHQLWIEVLAAGDDPGEMDVSLATDEADVDLVAR